MMETKGLMGGFYRISEWIMRFFATNMLWMLTSIPVVLLFVRFFLLPVELPEGTDEESIIWTAMLFISVLAPFTIFPATSGLFSLARKWVTGDADVPIIKTFFVNFKQSYVQSMVAGIIYCLLIYVEFVGYRFYLHQENVTQYLSSLYVAFIFVTFVSVFMFFSLQAHLHMRTFALIKNAVLLSVGKPLTSIAIMVTNIAIIILFFSFYKGFLAVFFLGSTIAFMTFFHFNRMFQKIQDKQLEYQEAQKRESEEDDSEK